MGQTREKKTSKRALKAPQPTSQTPIITHRLEHTPTDSTTNSTGGKNPASNKNRHLAPAPLSSKTSISSLQSSTTSNSQPVTDKYQKYDPALVEVRYTPIKGFALFATSRIPKGTLVLAEVPLMRLTSGDEAEKSVVDELLVSKFESLPRRLQKDFNKLHDAKKEGFSKIKSIFHSNCYNLEGFRSKFGGSCIGVLASRINHSCTPNVQFTFAEEVPVYLCNDQSLSISTNEEVDEAEHHNQRRGCSNGLMMFHALKTIAKDKEILSNYETVYATKRQRQLQLQMHYAFSCDCEACTGSTEFWAKSDDRRREMIKYRSALKTLERNLVATKTNVLTADGPLSSSVDSSPQEDPTASSKAPGHIIIEYADEAVELLGRLEQLLVKEGLFGVELEKVRQKTLIWTERAKSCRQYSLESETGE